MDAREAREHLEMVDEIIRRGEQTGWSGRELGITLILFGLGAALLDVAYQNGSVTSPVFGLLAAGLALLLAGMVFLVWWLALMRRTAERVSLAQVRMGRVMGAVWWSVAIASLCQPHVFSNWSASAIWSLGGAITMFVSGSFGERRAIAGGVILLASMLAGNYFPSVTGYALAAGFLAGYVAIGVLYFFGVGGAESRE